MKYYFALCDDNREHLNILRSKLYKIMNKRNEKVAIDTYDCGKDLVKCIKQCDRYYDVIFLDMQMPVNNGVEVGKQIRKFDESVVIVFVTGFVDYALNAFEIRAFDYLLKPINAKRLKKTIDDVIKRIDINKRYKNDADGLFTFTYNKIVINVKFEEILFIEKSGNKVIITCEDQQYEVYESLDNVSKRLNENLFIQTHQGFIVNKKRIEKYEKNGITLELGYEIPVSRNKSQIVKKAFFDSLR